MDRWTEEEVQLFVRSISTDMTEAFIYCDGRSLLRLISEPESQYERAQQVRFLNRLDAFERSLNLFNAIEHFRQHSFQEWKDECALRMQRIEDECARKKTSAAVNLICSVAPSSPEIARGNLFEMKSLPANEPFDMAVIENDVQEEAEYRFKTFLRAVKGVSECKPESYVSRFFHEVLQPVVKKYIVGHEVKVACKPIPSADATCVTVPEKKNVGQECIAWADAVCVSGPDCQWKAVIEIKKESNETDTGMKQAAAYFVRKKITGSCKLMVLAYRGDVKHIRDEKMPQFSLTRGECVKTDKKILIKTEDSKTYGANRAGDLLFIQAATAFLDDQTLVCQDSTPAEEGDQED